MTWKEIKQKVLDLVIQYPVEYCNRLDYEIAEIEKQGLNDYWVELIATNNKFEHNKNGLVLPFLLGITTIDPIKSNIAHIKTYLSDFPDADIDFEAGVREHIEKFAAREYGQDKVCSVGLWQTYKPKLALQDAARALGGDLEAVMALTKVLPDEFDKRDYEYSYKKFPDFQSFAEKHKELVNMAYRMVGGIKAQGRHAGGLIISSVPIKEHIPLALTNKRWASTWTEGRSLQLSKFGFVKFDILGVQTLSWIKSCLKLIKQNRNISIEWGDIDPEVDRAGWITYPDGKRKIISLNDEDALDVARQLRTETVFQLETPLAKGILSEGGIKSFSDIITYISLGRPGPLQQIPHYIKRRDGEEDWEKVEHPAITKILKDTYSVCVFQEQISTLLTNIAGFSIVEAEATRKAVSKKWIQKLMKIKDKWIVGAAKVIGQKNAEDYWPKLETFAEYAFNKSHAVSYALVAHRCLYLKANFPAEWWAAVLSDCDNDKLSKYINYAKADKVEFGMIDIENASLKFSVRGNVVTPGITSIKNIDSELAQRFVLNNQKYIDLDDFITKNGKNKIACERLIKLGAFDDKHKNRKALWLWYQYQYGTDDDSKQMKKLIKCAYAWPIQLILTERERQTHEYKKQYPKRNLIPDKILKWIPKIPYPNAGTILPSEIDDVTYKNAKQIKLSKEQIFALAKDDFSLKDLLSFEKEYLGYCVHSPMDLFKHAQNTTIANARTTGILEVYVEKMVIKKKSVEFGELIITDGTESARVMIWSDELIANGLETFKDGAGLRMHVKWNNKWKSFNLYQGSIVIPLERI